MAHPVVGSRVGVEFCATARKSLGVCRGFEAGAKRGIVTYRFLLAALGRGEEPYESG